MLRECVEVTLLSAKFIPVSQWSRDKAIESRAEGLDRRPQNAPRNPQNSRKTEHIQYIERLRKRMNN